MGIRGLFQRKEGGKVIGYFIKSDARTTLTKLRRGLKRCKTRKSVVMLIHKFIGMGLMEEGELRDDLITNSEAWPFTEYVGQIDISPNEWKIHTLRESTKEGLKVVEGFTQDVLVGREIN